MFNESLVLHEPRRPSGERQPRDRALRAEWKRTIPEKMRRKPQILWEIPSLRLKRDDGFYPRNHREFLIYDYLQNLGTPRALTVWLLFRQAEHRQLVELKCDPLDYPFEGVDQFKRDYAATKFLSKCVGLKTHIDLEAVAIASAEEAEVKCRETNNKVKGWRVGMIAEPDIALLQRVKAKIASILGDVPASFPDVGWSKGRTTSAFKSDAEDHDINFSSTYKYSSRPDVTVSALKRSVKLLRDCPSWGAAVLNADAPCSVLTLADCIVRGNVMLTVPKNAKTDRVICYEPHMNIRLQLGVGGYIRRRLLRHGVNLNDQSINQRRARLGSKTGHLATIDLRMASDTVALEMVYELLPLDWAMLLDDLRSKYTQWPGGQWRRNEKFSSMGNGFTFELESLIFFAACSAVTGDVTVYGDDIVLPTDAYGAAVHALELFGFVVNAAKSYSTTAFRESCGMDAIRGVPITPVYLRSLPKTREDVVLLHNQVRRWATQMHNFGDARVEQMLQKWRYIHPCPLGPQGTSDGHYHVDFETAAPQRAKDWVDGWWYETFVKVKVEDDDRPSGDFPGGLGYAALCASTGPKRVSSIWDSVTDRRQFSYRRDRSLASFTWPSAIWT